MAGLLDFLNSPSGAGLLSGVASYAMNARRGEPINNLGRGLSGGIAGYTGANDKIKLDQKAALQKQFIDMKLQQMQQTMAKSQQQNDWRAGLPAAMAPKLTGSTDQGTQLADQNAAFGADGLQPLVESSQYANPDAPLNMNYGVDQQAAQNYMMQPGSPVADKILADKYIPKKEKFGNSPQYDQAGNAFLVGDQGNVKRLDGIKSRDKIISDDNGGTRTYRSEYSADPLGAVAKTSTPDAIMSDQRQRAEGAMNRGVTMRGQSMTDARARQANNNGKAQGNKPPSGYRYTQNGDLELIPGGPADVKQQQKLAGGSTVDTVIAALRDQYDKLDKSGGITNTSSGPVGNLMAGIQSSGAGQEAGKLFGTENQSSRNTINQTRPLLLQAIKKATGMSAKQMDSNTELKLYLSAATDPSLDVAANRRALDTIERLYGSGAGNSSITSPKGAPNKPQQSNAGQSNGFSVQAPNGKTYNFSSQKDLSNFKLKAGIR